MVPLEIDGKCIVCGLPWMARPEPAWRNPLAYIQWFWQHIHTTGEWIKARAQRRCYICHQAIGDAWAEVTAPSSSYLLTIRVHEGACLIEAEAGHWPPRPFAKATQP